MLHLHFSNRFELLQHTLLQALAAGAPGPFERPVIAVPGAAVQRSLELALAANQGVCAQLEFTPLEPWLRARAAEALGTVAAPLDATSPGAAPLAWRILQVLADTDFTATLPQLQASLAGADAPMRWELAQRCAEAFDRYAAWRPEWLQGWAAHRPSAPATDSPHEAWQGALWRRVVQEAGLPPRPPLLAWADALASGRPGRADTGLPAQLHVVAPTALPPLQLALLQRLARQLEVRLYVMNPCQEFWFDVVDRRRLTRLAPGLRATQHHEEGSRLLAAWGRQTQEQLGLLLEAADDAEIDDAGFVPAGGDTLLARLQDAVLSLQELAPASVALAADDHSIEAHVAHTRLREVQVLHGRLQALFAADPTLQPHEVLIATPDPAAVAPLVALVFDAPGQGIPIAATGLPAAPVAGCASARALLAALALAGSRLTASAALELLEQPVVARRFGLDDAALAQVRRAVDAGAIHAGLDGGRHGFAEGFSRLYLAYALPDGAAEPFGGRLPAHGLHGEDTLLALGGFWRFVDTLRRLSRRLSQPLPGAQWRAALLEALDALTTPGHAAEHGTDAALRAALAALHGRWLAGGAAELPLAPTVVRHALQAMLEAPAPAVPTGRVTLAGMAALRHLPFRVVCLLGLDDGAWPAAPGPSELDLMAHAPRRGDPQPRRDDRNVFLDLLLAAREKLLLSWVGRSPHDDAPRPPSALVAELLEVLLPAVATDSSPEALAAARGRLVVTHPLHPFDARAFDPAADERLRGGEAGWLRAWQRAAPADTRGLFAAALPLPPGDDWRQLTVEQLVAFFRHPARFLLTRRLALTLEPASDEVGELLVPDASARRALAQRLLPTLEADGFRDGPAEDEPERLLALAGAGTEFPEGPLGRLLLRRETRRLAQTADAWREAAAEPLPPQAATLTLDVDGERWTLSGHCAELRPQGLLRRHWGEAGANEHVEAWLWHLWLCAARPAGVAPRTRWLARDGGFELAEAAAPLDTLATLLRLYRQGLSRPLPFFARTAWAFVRGGHQLPAARAVWQGSPQFPGEGAHPAWRLALRGRDDPLDEAFVQCARAVFDSLRACLQEEGA